MRDRAEVQDDAAPHSELCSAHEIAEGCVSFISVRAPLALASRSPAHASERRLGSVIFLLCVRAVRTPERCPSNALPMKAHVRKSVRVFSTNGSYRSMSAACTGDGLKATRCARCGGAPRQPSAGARCTVSRSTPCGRVRDAGKCCWPET